MDSVFDTSVLLTLAGGLIALVLWLGRLEYQSQRLHDELFGADDDNTDDGLKKDVKEIQDSLERIEQQLASDHYAVQLGLSELAEKARVGEEYPDEPFRSTSYRQSRSRSRSRSGSHLRAPPESPPTAPDETRHSWFEGASYPPPTDPREHETETGDDPEYDPEHEYDHDPESDDRDYY